MPNIKSSINRVKKTEIQTKINRNTGSGNGPQSEYLYSTVAGAFKDSFGNSNGLTRIAQPNKRKSYYH